VKEGAVEGTGLSPTYELVARALGKRLLRFMEDHPEDASKPVFLVWVHGMPTELTLEHAAEAAGVDLDELHPTGFQVGWAANAAKYVLGLPPVRNSALASLRGPVDLERLRRRHGVGD